MREALRPGQSVELLKALHILTRDGRLNQDSRRKLKQVEHLVQFIEKIVGELAPRAGALTLADHGAGKSYLGFILYDLLLKGQDGATVYGIETRPELVERSRALAERLGFARMRFLNIAAADAAHDAALPERIDIVTALHACDSATDDAIAFGLAKQAQAMVLVPCCQAELAARLRMNKALAAVAHAAGRAVAPPAAHARAGQPADQRAALPVPGIAGLQRDRDRAGGLGAQPEERADHRPLDGPQEAQRRRAPARAAGRIRPGCAGAAALCGAGGDAASAGRASARSRAALHLGPEGRRP
ncbi:hypothetical protein MASR1M50_23880 [Burkholderiales bacterium]